MIILKTLGFIDLLSSVTLLSIIFSINIPFQIILFLGVLLFMKGLFILTGDLFSILDIGAAAIFFMGLIFNIPIIVLWIFSLFLMSKGLASFL